jgi:hypothetical protein
VWQARVEDNEKQNQSCNSTMLLQAELASTRSSGVGVYLHFTGTIADTPAFNSTSHTTNAMS